MTQEGLEIPYQALSPDALRNLVEMFVLGEGTDYGEREASFETKVAQVHKQLERGEAKIRFDPDQETCAIFAKNAPPSPKPRSSGVDRDDSGESEGMSQIPEFDE